MFPAFLTTILFSISAVTAHRMTKLLGGVEANFLRITLATLLLAVWAHGFGQGITGDAFLLFLLSGCVGFGIGDTALYQALPLLGSRLSILLVHCFAAPFAAMTEWLWIGTTLTPAQIGWSLVILAGVSAALAPGTHRKIAHRSLAIGTAYGLLAAFGQGFGAVLSRKAFLVARAAGDNIDGLTAAYQRILAGWVVAAIFLLVVKRVARFHAAGRESAHETRSCACEGAEPLRDEPPCAFTGAATGERPLGSDQAGGALEIFSKWRLTWPWIVANALCGPTLGVGCYQWALLTTPTGIVLPIVAISPLVVIPFAHAMEGERPSARSLIGGVIAVAGAVGLTQVR